MSFYSCENEPLEGFDLVIETPTSTSPGNTTGGNSGSTDILLKKITSTFSGGFSVDSDFFYSGNNLIETVVSDGYTDKFIYDNANKIIEIEEYEGVNLDTTYSITYDSNGNIASIATTSGSTTTTKTYVTDSNGVVTETSSNGVDTILYYFSNDNLVKIVDTNGEGDYDIIYDSKNGPFKNVSNKKLLSIFYQSSYSTNNPLSSLNSNASPQSYDEQETTYTYNSENYPITSASIQRYKSISDPQEYTDTVNEEYFYD